MTSAARANKEQGSAFVSVLALMFVLSALAVISVHSVLDTAYMGRQTRLGAQVDAALDTAFAQAFYRVSSGDDVVRYGDPFTVQTSLAEVEVKFFSPSGRLDINRAAPLLMSMLMQAAGSDDATALADAIVDWRDGDDFRSNQGAEQNEYELAALEGPANHAFGHEQELSGVLGMTEEILACVLGEITVASGDMTPDLRFSSPWLKRALNPDAPLATSMAQMPVVALGAGDLIGLEMRVIQGSAQGRGASAMIRLTGNPNDPYWVQAFDDIGAGEHSCPAVATL
jgi:general secretion pathway protein K